MDYLYYKELISRLNEYSNEYQRHGGITAEAANAIEILLAETEWLRNCTQED